MTRLAVYVTVSFTSPTLSYWFGNPYLLAMLMLRLLRTVDKVRSQAVLNEDVFYSDMNSESKYLQQAEYSDKKYENKY